MDNREKVGSTLRQYEMILSHVMGMIYRDASIPEDIRGVIASSLGQSGMKHECSLGILDASRKELFEIGIPKKHVNAVLMSPQARYLAHMMTFRNRLN